ncbi:hypothetical protein V6N13_071353 [Hibiscus sabdariffa]
MTVPLEPEPEPIHPTRQEVSLGWIKIGRLCLNLRRQNRAARYVWTSPSLIRWLLCFEVAHNQEHHPVNALPEETEDCKVIIPRRNTFCREKQWLIQKDLNQYPT